MKVFYTLLIAGLLQFLLLKPLKAANRPRTAINLAQDKLIQLYDETMSPIDKEYAEKSYDLSENILKDIRIQVANSMKLKIFKQNITDYIHRYPFHKRYNLYNRLVEVFTGLTLPYYNEQSPDMDLKYIKNLLQKLGYKEMSEKYNKELGNFVKVKLVKEFEKFSKNLVKKEEKLKLNLQQWCDKTKKCQNYLCYVGNLDSLIKILYTPKDKLFDAIYVKVDKINNKYAIAINQLLQKILKDPKIKELDNILKENLIKNVKEFINKYAQNKDISHLDDLLQYFHTNITQNYYNNAKLSSKDHQLLKAIFDKHGFKQIREKNQYLLDEFIKNDMPIIFENFKNSLNLQKTPNDQALLQWYENVKNLKTYEERRIAFDKLFQLHNN